MTLVCVLSHAQSVILTQKGSCGDGLSWTFDGKTLTITNTSKPAQIVTMPDYNLKNNIAPWTKKNLAVRSLRIGKGIRRIGACAFANCKYLSDVVFESNSLTEIGWGAFYNCVRLRNISLPQQLRKVETIAFANCSALTSISIPDQCRVEDQAFVNCTDVQVLNVSPTASIGQYVFAHEVTDGGKVRHALYNNEIRRLPVYINAGNCSTFGISRNAMEIYLAAANTDKAKAEDYDYKTSSVDSIIPIVDTVRANTYALVIGNQNYRFVPKVPYAIHDARVFKTYCEKVLGIPSENIHLSEDATKQMLTEEEKDWLESISNREDKKLIVYYAGHGVPDTKDNNKAYLLPTDVRGTKPQHGIALNDFYAQLGNLGFKQTSVFLDACFSGMNRDNESVDEGTRGAEITPEEATLGTGNVVVFSAAQDNETAQGYNEQGHGLFTYYLLKDLADSYGDLNFGSLSDYLKANVNRTALTFKDRKSQNPTVAATAEASGWRSMEF